MLRGANLDVSTFETQSKFIQERFTAAEENLWKLFTLLQQYTRNVSKCRNSRDEIAQHLHDTAVKETINLSMKSSTVNLSKSLAALSDHMTCAIQSVESDVLKALSESTAHCRKTKSDLNSICGANDKEINRRKQLTKISQKAPRDPRSISLAETELAKARLEVSHSQRALEEAAEIFEKKKLKDLKTILLKFVKCELRFHAEAVQILSQAYQGLSEIDTEKDIEGFRDVLKGFPKAKRVETIARHMPLGRIGSPFPFQSVLPPSSEPKQENSDRSSAAGQLNGSYEETSESETSSESSPDEQLCSEQQS